jgi:hypothetical protein
VNLDETIHEFGLAKVERKFNQEELFDLMGKSSSFTMLVLRSSGFFSAKYLQLKSRMEEDKSEFELRVVLPDPCNVALMTLMSAKFTDANTPQKLAASIADVVNLWIKASIYDKLRADRRHRVTVCFIDKYPLYSAYLFDDKEFWYIPYHHRNDHQDIPVFVFQTDFARTEVFQDFEQLLAEAKPHDLSNALVLPAGLQA